MVDPRWILVVLGWIRFFECYIVLQIIIPAGWIRRMNLPFYNIKKVLVCGSLRWDPILLELYLSQAFL